MHRNKVVQYLQDYNRNSERKKRLLCDMRQLTKQLEEELQQGKYETLHSPTLDGLPRATTPANPVERWYEELEKRGGLSQRALDIKATLKVLGFEYKERTRQIDMVDDWLRYLKLHEALLLRITYVQAVPEGDQAQHFFSVCKYTPSAEQMQKIRNKALNKIVKLENKKVLDNA